MLKCYIYFVKLRQVFLSIKKLVKKKMFIDFYIHNLKDLCSYLVIIELRDSRNAGLCLARA